MSIGLPGAFSVPRSVKEEQERLVAEYQAKCGEDP